MNIGTAPTLDIGRTLDDGLFTGMQKMAVFMAAMAIVLDGFDGQLIGFAIPLMIKEWGISREAFGPAVAAGLIGMAVGMAVAGVVADRIGRRLVLAASVFVFGVTTISIGFAPNILALTVLRPKESRFPNVALFTEGYSLVAPRSHPLAGQAQAPGEAHCVRPLPNFVARAPDHFHGGKRNLAPEASDR